MDNQPNYEQQQPNYQQPNYQQPPTKYCQHCGQVIAVEAVVCPYCGCQVEVLQGQPAPVVVQPYIDPYMASRRKDKWVAFLLCFFLGGLGIHKFYEGKIGMGILYIFTVGLFGIGWLVDIIVILCRPNPYYI